MEEEEARPLLNDAAGRGGGDMAAVDTGRDQTTDRPAARREKESRERERVTR